MNLFCSYDGGRTLQPSPSSSLNDTHISYFELIGKVIGLALLHGETVPMRFSTPFLKRILGHTLTPEDLSLVDPEAYKRCASCPTLLPLLLPLPPCAILHVLCPWTLPTCALLAELLCCYWGMLSLRVAGRLSPESRRHVSM